MRLGHEIAQLQHPAARLRSLPHPPAEHLRLLLSAPRAPLSQSASPELLALPLTALWNRRADRHRIRAPITNRLRLADRSMSASLLERDVPAYGRLHFHDQRLRRRGH